MITYRAATPQDAERADLRALALRGLATMEFAGTVSQPQLSEVLRAATSGSHYAEIAEIDGRVVAYFGALIVPHLWFERFQMQVVGWYTEVPGAGLELLKRALRWMREQMRITLMVVTVNPITDSKAARAMNRLMRQTGAIALPTYIYHGG